MEKKLAVLKDIIREYDSALVAFSGGVDSTFLLKVCAEVLEPEKLLAVTAKSLVIPEEEMEEAARLARVMGVRHRTIDFDVLSIKQFAENTPDRCYHCKKAIFSIFADTARNERLNWVFDGTNVDDTGDFRPGMKALSELSVKSPLKEAGLTKEDIRNLSREMGLPTWNMPSMACLASRFPYGDDITQERLHRVAVAEKFIKELGFTQFRVRSHGDIARIEVQPDKIDKFLNKDLRNKVVAHLKAAGFDYITLDLSGYRTGSMNEVLEEGDISAWRS